MAYHACSWAPSKFTRLPPLLFSSSHPFLLIPWLYSLPPPLYPLPVHSFSFFASPLLLVFLIPLPLLLASALLLLCLLPFPCPLFFFFFLSFLVFVLSLFSSSWCCSLPIPPPFTVDFFTLGLSSFFTCCFSSLPPQPPSFHTI